MKKIIFLQSKLPTDIIALSQIANRWNSYGEFLQKQDGDAQLLIFTPKPLGTVIQEVLVSGFIKQFPFVEKKTKSFSRLNALRKQIQTDKSPVILVCGDNQVSLILALILRVFLGKLIRIQIQFHGDTYSFHSNKGIQGFARVILSRLGIAMADSIRVVSKFQFEEINGICKSAQKRIILAPIPIDFSRVAMTTKQIRFDVAFIGRFHSERGISDLVKIVKLLKLRRPDARIVIVGKGPLEKKIKREFLPWLKDSTISMPGFLPETEILDIYSSTRVLISTAPKEGYGLTLREAALSNVYVVARESKGSLETKELFPARIETFLTVDVAVAMIENQLGLPFHDKPIEEIAFQLKADEEGLNRLIKSWVDY